MRKFIGIIILTSTVLFSCKKDLCKDVNCANGACNDGTCICETGFEGANCETEQRQAFVGTYSVDESCDLGDFSYAITISANSEDATLLTINNIGDFNFDIIAAVDGNSISIDHETGNGATVIGDGTLTNGILSVTYTMTTSSNQVLNCSMVCTLQ